MFLVGKRFALSSTQPNPPSCTDLKDSSSCFTVKAPSSRSKWSSQALMLGGSGSGQLLPGRTSWNLCLLACSCPSSCLFPLLCRCSFYCLFFCRVPWSYPCLRSCLHSPSVSTSSPPNDVLARFSRNTRRRMSVQIGQVLFRLASAFCLSCWSRKPSTSVGSPPSRRFFRTQGLTCTSRVFAPILLMMRPSITFFWASCVFNLSCLAQEGSPAPATTSSHTRSC